MTKHRITQTIPIIICACLLMFPHIALAQKTKTINDLYERVALDLTAGRPLTVTVYIALCDNDSQGIVPTRNRSICKGDMPRQNIYWGTTGGIEGYLRQQGWKQIHRSLPEAENLAIIGVWKKSVRFGYEFKKLGISGRHPVHIVGLGYQGSRIKAAITDYFRAVSSDDAEQLTLTDGTPISYGGASHIIGYIGHNYLMDVDDTHHLLSYADGNGTLTKGVFGLACFSNDYFRPAIERRNTHILVLNTNFAYPSATIIGGIIEGTTAGLSSKGVRNAAARAFAKGQNRSVGTMIRALSYGN